METRILENLGLTKGESKVYLALLEKGSSTTGPIAKYSGITHSKVYKILDKLTFKGLVSYVLRGKIRYYSASEPKKVLKLIEQKRALISQQEEIFKKELPLLEEISKKSREKSRVEVFEGFEGLKTVFDEMLDRLEKGNELLTLGISKVSGQIQRYFYHFFKKQAKKGFKIKAIFNENAKDIAKERANKYTSFKFMPGNMITPTVINIYGDKTIMNTRSEGEQFFTIVITNRETAESYRTYFELLWKIAKL